MAKVTVDKNTCIGCGSCVEICPRTFVLKAGKSVVKKAEVKDPTLEKQAEAACPVNAIKVKD